MKFLFKNKLLLVYCILLIIYYYLRLRSSVFMLSGEVNHTNAYLSFAMMAITIYAMVTTKSIASKISSVLYPFAVYIIVIGFIYMLTPNLMVISLQWLMPYIISLKLVKDDDDAKLMTLTMLIISIMSIIMLYISIGIGTYVNSLAEMSSENLSSEAAVNIIAITMSILPIIMLIKNNTLKWALLSLSFIGVISSARKMALISTVFVLICVIMQDKNSEKPSSSIKSLLFAFIGGFAIYTLFTGSLADIWTSTIDRYTSFADDKGSDRQIIWNNVANYISDKSLFSFLFGDGYLGVSRNIGHTAAHNEFLEFFVDFGIPGLVMYIVMHVRLIKESIIKFRCDSNIRYSYLACYLVFLTYSSFGNVILYPMYAIPFFCYWGLVENKNIISYK